MILPRRGEAVDRERRAELRKKFLEAAALEERVEELKSQDQIRLHDVFSNEDVHRLCDEMQIDFRDTCFTPATTLGLFVAQALSRGNSCSTMVTEYNRERKRKGLPPVCEDASAYCKARARLPVDLISRLDDQIVEIASSKTRAEWKWKGLDVYLVDGFVFRAPDTAANQEVYPQPSSQPEGLGFPQIRVVVATSLATGCISHFNTGPVEGKNTGEVSLFREMHSRLSPGAVAVTDSNFESFHDAVLLTRQDVNLVCCINGSRNDPFQGPCETIEEKLETLKKPKFDKNRFTREEWEELPPSIDYRMIRYRVAETDKVITIVTTLLDRRRFPASEIVELYGLRWDVEPDIRSCKTTMDMCDLSCQTPGNLDREIAVGVLAYNLVRLLMNDAAAVLTMHPREMSFSQARDAWRNFGDELETTNDLMWIILSASARFVRDRPNRREPRAIKKRRTTKYPTLSEPRPSRARHLDMRPPD